LLIDKKKTMKIIGGNDKIDILINRFKLVTYDQDSFNYYTTSFNI